MVDHRVNIKVNGETRDRLRASKREGETWDGLLRRAANALEEQERRGGQQSAPVCSECGVRATTWTLIDESVHCSDCADVEF